MSPGRPGEMAQNHADESVHGQTHAGADGASSELLAFLIADIRGYTTFTQLHGDEAGAKLTAKFAEIVRELVTEFGGTVFELRGDEALCVFTSPRQCLRLAVALQQRFVAETLADAELPMPVGIGIDVGEAVHGADGYRGGALNLAARLCGQADAGEVLTTSEVTHLTRTIQGIHFVPLDAVSFRGLPDPVPPVQVIPEGENPAQQMTALLAAATPPPAFSIGPAAALADRQRRRKRSVIAGAVAVVVLAAAGVITGFVVSNGHSGSFEPRWNSDVVNVFDLSGTLRNQIQVGRNPSAITAAGSSLWVTNQDDRTVTHVDLKTSRTRVITDVGDAPAGVAFGNGRAWVVSTTNGQKGFPNTGTVTPINPATDAATAPFSAGQQAGGIAYGDGRIWVAATLESQLYSFDPAHPGAPQRIDVGTAPTGIAVTGKAVWVTNAGDESVSEIEPGSGQLMTRTPITVGVDPVAVAVGQSGAWVANHLSGTVTHIDPKTGNVTNIRVGGGPSGVAVTDDAVWVTTEYSGALVRIDPATNMVSRPIAVPGAPRAIAVDGDRLYVASATSYQGHTGGQLRLRVAIPSYGTGYPIVDATWDADPVTYFIRNATTSALITNALAPGPAGGSLVADLAESVPSVTRDKTQYVFTLRPGLRYSNGERVVAGDVRTSFQRALIEDRGDYLQSPLESLVGAHACINTQATTCDLSRGIKTDDASRTVRFILSRPNPDFLDFTELPIVPSSARTLTFDQVQKIHVPVAGTGPYRVGSMDWPRSIELVRNKYFQPRSGDPQSQGYPDSIVIEVNPKPSPQDLVDLENGSIDILDDQDLSLSGVQRAVSNFPIVKRDFGTVPLLSYAFLNNKLPPFDNLQARRALNYAVDRASALAQRAAGVDGTVTCQVIPPGFTGYRQFCPYTHDPAHADAGTWTGPDLKKAKELVRRSGTLGERVTVWPSSSPFHAPDGYFVKVLNEIGYHAKLHAPYRTNDDYDAAVAKGRAQIGMLVSGSGGFDGGGFISEWTCNAPQVAHNYCNHHFDALYRREVNLELTDPQRAHDILARLDRILVSQAALVPISTEFSFEMVSAKVGGWSTSDGGNLLGQLWVK